LFLSYHPDHRHLHSFPTRRSSDLRFSKWRSADCSKQKWRRPIRYPKQRQQSLTPRRENAAAKSFSNSAISVGLSECKTNNLVARSEEHTSELQSRFDLVCRLLLEK